MTHSDFTPPAENAWAVAAAVSDPEIPSLSVVDLGVVREIEGDMRALRIVITPTYSGCPAMQAIADDLVSAFHNAGYGDVEIQTRLAPAWTTDWITARGRQQLKQAGIAPPGACGSEAATDTVVKLALKPRCPQCNALEVEQISEFGSTACKALYRCQSCLEPFDYFKPI